MPFKYLGIPLTSKKATIIQYKPLLDKMLESIKSWTSKFLSYAGRVQLIKTILFSTQIFWSQVFILPKKVIQVAESLCKNFLWSGGVDTIKTSLIAWEKLCTPKITEGLGFLDITDWNRAVICKHLWNLCLKKDRLCIQWVHAYYIKGGPIWHVNAPLASWMVKKILKAMDTFEAVGHNEQEVIVITKFTIKLIYSKLRGTYTKVDWRRLICNNYGASKWKFILFLATWQRLLTRDRLAKWKTIPDTSCVLCTSVDESLEHLFFQCHYSAAIWNKVLIRMGIQRRSMI